MKNFIITEYRLRELLAAEAELLSLESNGVDCWSGYEYTDFTNASEVSLEGFKECGTQQNAPLDFDSLWSNE